MLERHEIEIFLTLARELHFGRTAQLLGVTTGRVSQVVKKLERRVGASLFARTSRRVALTPIGDRLAAELRPAVAELAAAVNRAVEAGRGVTGTLRVAFVGEWTAPTLLRAVAVFTERHPDCVVDVREAPLSRTRAALDDGSVDILLASFPFDGMRNSPALLTEHRLLAVGRDHELAGQESVSLEVLGDHPVVQYPSVTSAAFKRDRTPPVTPGGREVPTGPVGATFSEMLSLVAMGKGVLPVGAHARTYYPRPDLSYVPIRDAPPIHRGLVWSPAHETARIRAFVAAAVDSRSTGATAA